MITVIAGREVESSRLNSPSRNRKASGSGASAIPRQAAHEAKPGTRTNGNFGRRAIQTPRPNARNRPMPERLIGSARCQSAALSALIPIVGPLASIPATTPLSAEKARWYEYVRRTSGANSGASRIVLRHSGEPVRFDAIRVGLGQNGEEYTLPPARVAAAAQVPLSIEFLTK